MMPLFFKWEKCVRFGLRIHVVASYLFKVAIDTRIDFEARQPGSGKAPFAAQLQRQSVNFVGNGGLQPGLRIANDATPHPSTRNNSRQRESCRASPLSRAAHPFFQREFPPEKLPLATNRKPRPPAPD